ncbi:MAG: STAS domain-containing protein [bacterium]|nr:STAS domain-containing protein [bacterium]
MAIQFHALKISDPGLFGVSLTGTVSRSDKAALEELAQQATARNKVKLVLDLSRLSSLGGSGARVLAEFQRQLLEMKGEAVFVGVGTVVRHFLDGKFNDLPLRYYLTVEDAVENFDNNNYSAPDHSLLQSAASATDVSSLKDTEDHQMSGSPKSESNSTSDEVGAMSFYDDEDEDPDSGLDGLLEEFTGKDARKGRRREHHYTSLNEAISSLGTLKNEKNRQEFSEALTNLLFSQGLADDVTLLFPVGLHLKSVNEEFSIPLAGSLARQLVDYGRPLTILDLLDDELVASEVEFLEELNPEIILPLLQDRQLIGVLLLNNHERDRDYTVGENFAFELLIEVLSKTAADDLSPSATLDKPKSSKTELLEAAQSVASTSPTETLPELNETLYHLALDLPEADDRPHFWRIFWRHAKKTMPLDQLAFLAPNGKRPQVMAGYDNDWLALDLSHDRLSMFFRSIERPVKVSNLPSLFGETKSKMIDAGIDWLVSLKWDDQYLGMCLLGGKLEEMEMFPEDRLMQIFEPTAQLLSRFDGHHDNADVTQGIVQTLMGEREIRCFGSDMVTESMVSQLNLLASEMGFPPDQHRDLVYGCLLRDLGMVGQPDEMMVAPSDMAPEQLQVYYQHPERGRNLLAGRNLPSTIVEVVSCHHERFNGQGYPEGLAGKDIPLSARVVSVVENYVAMIQGVGLPEPLSAEEAAVAIREDEGGRFDPDIVSVFLQAMLSEAGSCEAEQMHDSDSESTNPESTAAEPENSRETVPV